MTTIEHWGIPESHFWTRGERPTSPVQHDPESGTWNVYGHAETLSVLGDPTTYSSNTTRLFPQMQEFVEGDPLQLDPPDHTKLRKLVSHAFTPKVVAGLEPRIAELTGELLGVPSSDRDLFTGWVDEALGRTETRSTSDPTPDQEQQTQDSVAMFRTLGDYLAEHADERREHPREDLLTKLVEAEVDGGRLTRAEVAHSRPRC